MKNLNRQSERDSRRSGFTLIELLLVIAIIAILSSLGLAIMAGAEEDALVSRTKAQIERMSKALEQKLEDQAYRILPFHTVPNRPPVNGIHDGANNVPTLISSTQTWTNNQWVGDTVINVTDGSSGLITANTATTVTAILSGGTENDWDTGDNFTIVPSSPDLRVIREFRNAVLNEFLRVEFPWTQDHLDPNSFPEDATLNATYGISAADLPQISRRYRAFMDQQNIMWINKMFTGTTPEELEVFQRTVSAECLYAILSLNTDEFGSRFVDAVRPEQIGDTDGDGVREVLDAFGDPLRFALVAVVDAAERNQLRMEIPPNNISDSMDVDYSEQFGFEVELSTDPVTDPLPANQPIGLIRGRRPIHEYRLLIQSVNTGDKNPYPIIINSIQ